MGKASKNIWLIVWLNLAGVFASAAIWDFHALNRPTPLLDKSLSVPAPDGKVTFVMQKSGTAQLVETATGRILYTQVMSTQEFKGITATWRDNRSVQIDCTLRYPLLMNTFYYLWDRKSGLMHRSVGE